MLDNHKELPIYRNDASCIYGGFYKNEQHYRYDYRLLGGHLAGWISCEYSQQEIEQWELLLLRYQYERR